MMLKVCLECKKFVPIYNTAESNEEQQKFTWKHTGHPTITIKSEEINNQYTRDNIQ